jgi:hypothetical protein
MSTHSATLSFDESPTAAPEDRASIFSTARSVISSTPTIFAGISRLSPRTTDTCALTSPTTWLLVRR